MADRRQRQPFEQIVSEHGEVVMRVCRSLVGPRDADDAWSETFLAALRAYPRLAPDSNVRGWLVTIAHNTSIDLLRRRRRSTRALAAPPTPPMATAEHEFDATLRDALNALPPTQRRAVVYRHVADMSYDDIGRLLGSNAAAARRNVADALASLRRLEVGGTR